jgi:hypothetical protein
VGVDQEGKGRITPIGISNEDWLNKAYKGTQKYKEEGDIPSSMPEYMKEAMGKYVKKRMNRKSIKSKSPMTLVDFKGDNLPEE